MKIKEKLFYLVMVSSVIGILFLGVVGYHLIGNPIVVEKVTHDGEVYLRLQHHGTVYEEKVNAVDFARVDIGNEYVNSKIAITRIIIVCAYSLAGLYITLSPLFRSFRKREE
jgi:hypothetical protein